MRKKIPSKRPPRRPEDAQPRLSHSPAPQLTVVSANVRGLRTNAGELSHNCVLRHKADIVAVSETWLNSEVEPTYGRIPGYTHWVRKDRIGRTGGGVAACFKNDLQTQEVSPNLPHLMEALFFRIVLQDNSGLLLCVLYRPPRQGRSSFDFLAEELDNLLQRHGCKNILIVGDLNFHLEQQAYENLVSVQGLVNHVTFPTHERGGLLDPVLSDLPEANIRCQQLDKVGSSDHHAVLTHIHLPAAREGAVPRTIWMWDKADWPSLRQALHTTDWEALLIGDVEEKTRLLTSTLLALQSQFVPHRMYLTKATDPPWFGIRCRAAADAKYSTWRRYKRRPTHQNLALHRAACRRMTATSKWARKHWEEVMKRKLSGPGVGNKTWWALVKERQGILHQDSVPPLTRPDGSTATSSEDKAALLAKIFAEKMQVGDPNRPPPVLPREADHTITSVLVTAEQVEKVLRDVDVGKATGPDNISPRILKNCARELSGPLATIFAACLEHKKWPAAWKEAHVVPVHKKESRSDPRHYRPISLLSAVGKVFEKMIGETIWRHLNQHNLLSPHQFGFRPGRSTSDLLLLLSQKWQDTLDEGLGTLVVALDIAGAFDRVWHPGLLAKLRAKGVDGSLLMLLEDYLQGRTLRVVLNGRTSKPARIRASVPQGSVLGPVLWNVYIDDLLRQIPAVEAYADDCTISLSYCRQDSQRAVAAVNKQLKAAEEWGRVWQVDFAPNKTHAMVISRSPAAPQAVEGQLRFEGVRLPLQENIKILGVTIDRELRYDQHITSVARQTSQRVSALRRVAGSLDSRGILTLYKAQIRPCMEYGALAWMSGAATHTRRLDAVQRRALRLLGEEAEIPASMTSLEHRRDVSALAVCHKAQVLRTPHLTQLCLPLQPALRTTRQALAGNQRVVVPLSHTSQHKRTYKARTARLWNGFTGATPDVTHMSIHQAKLAANTWRGTLPTSFLPHT